jgi:putative transposase
MPDPKPPVVELSAAQRLALQTLVNRHSTPQQLALRARLILDAEAGLNNSEIGRKHGFSTNSGHFLTFGDPGTLHTFWHKRR